jgi:protein-tyrosine phosphatase
MNRTKITSLAVVSVIITALIIIGSFQSAPPSLPAQQDGAQNFETLVNFRDLGNYKTKDGRQIVPHKLLRSGSLFNLNNHDRDLLTETYKLRHIVDLRQPIEIVEAPNRQIDDITYHHLDLYSDGIPGSSSFTEYQRGTVGKVDVIDEMYNSYNRITTSRYSHENMRALFQLLLTNEDGSVLWHCSSGKDRTGVPTAILLHILGASKDTIYADYMFSNEARKEANAATEAKMRAEGASEQLIDETLQTLVVRKDYLDYTFKLMDEQYGGIDGFIENILQLNKVDQQKLRNKYVL